MGPNPDLDITTPEQTGRKRTLVFQAQNGDLLVRPGMVDKSAYRIVVLDPNPNDRGMITKCLHDSGYVRTYPASSISELESILEKTDPNLILTELDLGRGDYKEGLELMQRMDEEKNSSKLYDGQLLSGHGYYHRSV